MCNNLIHACYSIVVSSLSWYIPVVEVCLTVAMEGKFHGYIRMTWILTGC